MFSDRNHGDNVMFALLPYTLEAVYLMFLTG